MSLENPSVNRYLEDKAMDRIDAYYLRVSDSWSELTFAAYSKRVKVRRAA